MRKTFVIVFMTVVSLAAVAGAVYCAFRYCEATDKLQSICLKTKELFNQHISKCTNKNNDIIPM